MVYLVIPFPPSHPGICRHRQGVHNHQQHYQDSNSRSEVCVNYAGPMELRNDALVTACEGQSRRRLNQFYASYGQARTQQCSEPLVFYV